MQSTVVEELEREAIDFENSLFKKKLTDKKINELLDTSGQKFSPYIDP